MKTPKTWDELRDAGYVVELTEEQITTARSRLRDNILKEGLRVVDHVTGRTGRVLANGGVFGGDAPFIVAIDGGTYAHEIQEDGTNPNTRAIWELLS